MQVNERITVRLADGSFIAGRYRLEQATISRVVNEDLWHAVTDSGRKILISSEHIHAN